MPCGRGLTAADARGEAAGERTGRLERKRAAGDDVERGHRREKVRCVIPLGATSDFTL